MIELKTRETFNESGNFASSITIGQEVKISANETFDKATGADVIVGYAVTNKLTDGRGTASIFFNRKAKITARVTLAAGDFWKRYWDATSGTYQADTATATTAEGQVWIGGAAGKEIEVFQTK
ncbi:MAG: hypothetical protein MUC29_03655 [Pyrinomonadaceae bacterium]|jgi:hypothetical protein|nr:hypothetical protein [Pyrinomonadaceae bacterium]